MNIWILRNHNSQQYKVDGFTKAAEELGMNVETVFTEDCQLTLSPEGTTLQHKEKSISLPDAIISVVQLFTMSLSSHEVELQLYLESQDVFVLNTMSSREKANDKLATYRTLAEQGIPFPKTMVAFPEMQTSAVVSKLKLPFIVKPSDSFKGKGVMLMESEPQFSQFLEFAQHFMEPRQILLAQEFIASSKARDIRVIIVGDKVIGAMIRKGSPESIVSNFAAGGSVTAHSLDQAAEKIALSATKALGLQYAGVDLLFGENGYLVCEVNANPGFIGFEQATGIALPQEVVNYIKTQVSEK